MAKKKRHRYTESEIQVIRARYPTTLTRDLARELGQPEHSVYSVANRLGVKKDPAFLASEMSGRLRGDTPKGVATRFKAGQQSWNKGLHYAAGGRSAETQFKPGQRPAQWVPIGTVVVDGDGYHKRKVRDDAPPGMSRKNWVFMHRELWEQHHGPIPRGKLVAFINGRKDDLRIENIELVARTAWIKRHTIHNLPKDLADLVRLKGAVVRQINKRSRQHGE